MVINQIGSGLSSSPHNTPAPDGMARFPRVRVGDDVRAQHKLLTEKFGINQLQLVTGGSMGAQQTYEWAVRFPDMVKRAAPIAGTAKNTDHDFQFTETLNEAITSDPGWNGGYYKSSADVHRGLRRQARLWTVMGWSTEFFKQKSWRAFGFSSTEDFVAGFMEGYFLPMDPNNLLCMAWKWQRGDVSRNTGGDLKAALGRIKAKVFVMPIDEDMFFPPRDCEPEQKMIPNSEFRLIKSIGGHLALFGVDPGLCAAGGPALEGFAGRWCLMLLGREDQPNAPTSCVIATPISRTRANSLAHRGEDLGVFAGIGRGPPRRGRFGVVLLRTRIRRGGEDLRQHLQ